MRLSPSALSDFLACRHLTWLEQEHDAGRIELVDIPRPDAELVRERGLRHEERFREALIAAGHELVRIDGADVVQKVTRTREAMCDGAEVIYQAAFADQDGWVGFADFLLRDDKPSDLGTHSYEAYDTKLAKHPKPYFILQLAFYTEQIGRLQGWMPRGMHVVLGDGETNSFAYADFSAYVARVRRDFVQTVREGFTPPYPYPVEHCAWCRWWRHCADKRRADDHLSRVAGLGHSQGIKLETTDVHTMRGVAALAEGAKVLRLAQPTLHGLRLQAELQVHTEDTGEHVRRFLPLEEGRGFYRLPAPSAGDAFFDIEGDPYWGDEGLEYLLGTWTAQNDHARIWAHDEREEREALERWVDWITERVAAYPEAHVYHYNHYEPTALKRLMTKYGTREAQIDELLRREIFVDLYTVVRQAMRVGEPGYSLKNMEAFYPLERDAEVTEAGGSILAYEEWLESREQAKLDAIAEYNADDCRSTRALRDWLLEELRDAERLFGAVLPNRDAKPARELSERAVERQTELEELQARLTVGVDELTDDSDERARLLMSELLEYHRRESKPEWWAYFERTAKTPRELAENDSDALGDLTLATELELVEEKQSSIYPLRFPPQEHKISAGKAIEPATERTVNVVAVDDAAGIVWIKRAKRLHARPLPRAIGPTKPIDHFAHEDVVRRVAHRIIDRGLVPAGDLDASTDLLLRRRPRIAGVPADTPLDRDRVAEYVAALQGSVLFVQGPPGSGKTYVGARVIVDLLRDGLHVGVAATSHKAIHNMLDEVEVVAHNRRVSFVGLKKGAKDHPESLYDGRYIVTSTDNDDFPPPSEEVQLIAGTSWLFAREAMREAVDVLVVDEAGQVALADAVAMAQTARSVLLLGDPQQLAHVSQGTHSRGSGTSVLEHLLGAHDTVPPQNGILLNRTWRMHPDVCAFVSEAMYDGLLKPVNACVTRRVAARGELGGTGLRFVAVEHEGNRQTAPEEAEAIARIVEDLLGDGRLVGFEDRDTDRVTVDDILIVAPYNAQVRCLRAALPDRARIGTVDKFQGQEAPIVLFSMTSSTGEEVPRGMDFLFSKNRLNVAVSRAQCLAIIVASPALLTASCNTVEQMRLINALCQFADLAAAQAMRGENSLRPAAEALR
ncbi:MAG: TM0106 family RecB-like putative nuclease [Actinomycetota bacterium]|nr:TM0106 family RecB-like putative nuclease [Actinomycetota bacterium]